MWNNIPHYTQTEKHGRGPGEPQREPQREPLCEPPCESISHRPGQGQCPNED